jgi:subtilisin family serine protease
MSLGGATNRALNAALDASVLAGVMMVVAAGNEGSDACGISPASAELAFTVGSTNERDQRSDFSNSVTDHVLSYLKLSNIRRKKDKLLKSPCSI